MSEKDPNEKPEDPSSSATAAPSQTVPPATPATQPPPYSQAPGGPPGGPGAPGPVVQGQQPLSGPAPIRPPPPPYTGPGPKVCIFYLSPIEVLGSPIKSSPTFSCLWNREGSDDRLFKAGICS